MSAEYKLCLTREEAAFWGATRGGIISPLCLPDRRDLIDICRLTIEEAPST